MEVDRLSAGGIVILSVDTISFRWRRPECRLRLRYYITGTCAPRNTVTPGLEMREGGRDGDKYPHGKIGGIFRKTVAQVAEDDHHSANGDQLARGIPRSGHHYHLLCRQSGTTTRVGCGNIPLRRSSLGLRTGHPSTGSGAAWRRRFW